MSYLLSMLATMAKAQVDTDCDLIKLHCNYFNFEVMFESVYGCLRPVLVGKDQLQSESRYAFWFKKSFPLIRIARANLIPTLVIDSNVGFIENQSARQKHGHDKLAICQWILSLFS